MPKAFKKVKIVISKEWCAKGDRKKSRGGHMKYNIVGRSVQKVKVTRINNLFIAPNSNYSTPETIIRDYVYVPQVRIIA